MTEEIQLYIDDAKSSMKRAIAHLEDDLSKVRAGKANPAILNGVQLDYYGTMTPLNQVANISTPDARTIAIKPWEKGLLDQIERAIFEANIGLTPQSNGETIRLNLPVLTEERRLELVKKVKAIGENSKVVIRNVRRDANEGIKALKEDGVPEDEIKHGESLVQNLTDEYVAKVDKHLAAKEEEIMTV